MDKPNQPAQSMTPQQAMTQTADGIDLNYYYALQPSTAELIVFVHGYGEHAGCYPEIMEWYYRRGYHVASFDTRGHGKSSGPKGYVKDYQHYSNDLHQMLGMFKNISNPSATHIIAHSNGGLITAYYVLTHPQPTTIYKCVLSAPYLGIHPKALPPKPLQWLLKQSIKLLPHLKIPSPGKRDTLTHDPVITQSIQQDPLRLRIVSIQWFVAAEQAQQIVLAKAKQWPNIPVMLLLAGDDVLANNDSSTVFYEQLPIDNKQCIHYPGLYHEVLNELNREDTYEQILQWLQLS